MGLALGLFSRLPWLGGVFFAVIGAAMARDGLESARRYRAFEQARPVEAVVVSSVRASRFPPRHDVTVAWPDTSGPRQAVLRTGRRGEGLKPGDRVSLLEASAPGWPLLFADLRPGNRPWRIGPVETTDIAVGAVIMWFFGLLLFLRGRQLFAFFAAHGYDAD